MLQVSNSATVALLKISINASWCRVILWMKLSSISSLWEWPEESSDLDLTCIAPLQEIASGQLNLLQGDATRLNVRQLLEENGTNDQRWNVLANLPFNITTEVLKILLPMGDIISEVHVMLQVKLIQFWNGMLLLTEVMSSLQCYEASSQM